MLWRFKEEKLLKIVSYNSFRISTLYVFISLKNLFKVHSISWTEMFFFLLQNMLIPKYYVNSSPMLLYIKSHIVHFLNFFYQFYDISYACFCCKLMVAGALFGKYNVVNLFLYLKVKSKLNTILTIIVVDMMITEHALNLQHVFKQLFLTQIWIINTQWSLSHFVLRFIDENLQNIAKLYILL